MAIISSKQDSTPDKDPKPLVKESVKYYQVRLLEPKASSSEQEKTEEGIRPKRLDDYIGQSALKTVLGMAMEAAKSRNESMDHILLYGPPGLGKTTLAMILACELGVNCKITSAPALERPRDIVGLLNNLGSGDILFIDEIHRLSRMSEELLYPAMEDFRLDLTIGKGVTAKTRSLGLSRFTLVGATTKVGSLSGPLRDRFGLVERLGFYSPDELTLIINRSAQILQIAITPCGATEIAQRARGTPRIANRLLKRVRDYAQVKKVGAITGDVARDALELLKVDSRGLDWTDREMLSVMIQRFKGGPVGLEAIASAIGEDSHTIEEVYEPYLMQIGFLLRTPRGRVASLLAYQHLGFI